MERWMIACIVCLPLVAGCLAGSPTSPDRSVGGASLPPATDPTAWNWTDDSFQASGNRPGGIVLAVHSETEVTIRVERTRGDTRNGTPWVCTEEQIAKGTYANGTLEGANIVGAGCSWVAGDGTTEVSVRSGPVSADHELVHHELTSDSVGHTTEVSYGAGNDHAENVTFRRFLWAFDENPSGNATVDIRWRNAFAIKTWLGDREDTETHTQADFEAGTTVRVDVAGTSRYRTSNASLMTELSGRRPWTHFWYLPPTGSNWDGGAWGSIESPNGSVTPVHLGIGHGATNRDGVWTFQMKGTSGNSYDGPRLAVAEYEQLGFSWRDFP